MQDRLARPEAVACTEFKAQVTAGNVSEVFARGDTIEAALKTAASMPNQKGPHGSAVQDRTADQGRRGGHDEREQTLNQSLTEMHGFTGSEGVVVLAATNRPDVSRSRPPSTGPVRPPDRRSRARSQGPRRDSARPYENGPARQGRGSRRARRIHTRYDRRRSRESGERSGAPGRPPRPAGSLAARSDRRAGDGAAWHRAQRRDSRGRTTPDGLRRSRPRAARHAPVRGGSRAKGLHRKCSTWSRRARKPIWRR